MSEEKIPDTKEPWNKGGYMANVNDPSRGIHADLVIQDDIITTTTSDNSISEAIYLLTQNGYIVEKWPTIKSPEPQGEFNQVEDLRDALHAAREETCYWRTNAEYSARSSGYSLGELVLRYQEEIQNEEKFLTITNPNPDCRPSCR